MSNYMGLDLSLTSTGIVVVNSAGDVLTSGVVASKEKDMERLLEIRFQITQIMVDFNVMLTAIEGYAYHIRNSRALTGLAELGGVVRSVLYASDNPYVDIPPASVKKFATGKGNARKDLMRLAVYKRWGFEHESNDVVDAFVLAQMARAIAGEYERLTKCQRAVLKKLEGDL